MRSITDSFEIPFIETRWNYRSQKVIGSSGGYAFNLHPDITTLGGAYLDVLEAYHWETITILYQVGIELGISSIDLKSENWDYYHSLVCCRIMTRS